MNISRAAHENVITIKAEYKHKLYGKMIINIGGDNKKFKNRIYTLVNTTIQNDKRQAQEEHNRRTSFGIIRRPRTTRRTGNSLKIRRIVIFKNEKQLRALIGYCTQNRSTYFQ